MGPLELAEKRARLWSSRGSPRLARALGRGLQRSCQALPGGRADDLERLAARRSGSTRPLRAGTRRHTGGGSDTPARVLRTVHSFDPCLACAVHVLDTSAAASARGSPSRLAADGRNRPCRRRANRRALEAEARGARRAIYVWELPVRVVHWVIVLALIVLSITGYDIHHPFVSGAGGPGHAGFTMGTIRFVHEITGFVFTAAVLVRVYWAFVGNRFARWRALLPITRAQRRDLRDTVSFYALRRRHPRPPTATTRSRGSPTWACIWGSCCRSSPGSGCSPG